MEAQPGPCFRRPVLTAGPAWTPLRPPVGLSHRQPAWAVGASWRAPSPPRPQVCPCSTGSNWKKGAIAYPQRMIMMSSGFKTWCVDKKSEVSLRQTDKKTKVIEKTVYYSPIPREGTRHSMGVGGPGSARRPGEGCGQSLEGGSPGRSGPRRIHRLGIDWLVWTIPAGSGVQGLSPAAWHPALGPLGRDSSPGL